MFGVNVGATNYTATLWPVLLIQTSLIKAGICRHVSTFFVYAVAIYHGMLDCFPPKGVTVMKAYSKWLTAGLMYGHLRFRFIASTATLVLCILWANQASFSQSAHRQPSVFVSASLSMPFYFFQPEFLHLIWQQPCTLWRWEGSWMLRGEVMW